MKTAIILSIITLLFFSSKAKSQWLTDIQTESDWEYNFNSGLFDYNSFQLYREFTEGAEITDTSMFLSSSLGITNIETVVRQNSGNANDIAKKTSKNISKDSYFQSAHIRLGNKTIDNKSYNYMLASIEHGKISSKLKLRNDNGKMSAERRSLSFTNDTYSIIAGNYLTDYGCGLGIGRFDYRPVSFNKDDNNVSGILFPDNSYYNGIKAVYNNNYSILYSKKRYDDFYKTLYASSISKQIYDTYLGMTASHTRLSSSDGNKTLGAGSVFINTLDGFLKAEIAYGESGAGSAIRVVGHNYLFKGWYYDDSYINLQSSGYARSDYRSFTEDWFELSFRQPQTGEKGFFAKNRINIKNVDILGAAEVWKKPNGNTVNLDNSILMRFPINNNIVTFMRYSNLLSTTRNRGIIDLGTEFRRDFRIDTKISFWIENNSTVESKSQYYIFFALPLSDYLKMGARLRWKFDGSFDFFIEETIVLNRNFWLKATYRWRDDYGPDLGPLYIIMENRW